MSSLIMITDEALTRGRDEVRICKGVNGCGRVDDADGDPSHRETCVFCLFCFVYVLHNNVAMGCAKMAEKEKGVIEKENTLKSTKQKFSTTNLSRSRVSLSLLSVHKGERGLKRMNSDCTLNK